MRAPTNLGVARTQRFQPARSGRVDGMSFARLPLMASKRSSRSGKRKDRRPSRPSAAERDKREEELEGPPPREATIIRSDAERAEAEHVAAFTETSPELSGGDIDADWERAASVGEEAVGGSVATPDQDVVDDLGDALGVPRAPDEPVRTSEEILEQRDRRRFNQED